MIFTRATRFKLADWWGYKVIKLWLEQCGPGQHLSEVPISQQWATDRLWVTRLTLSYPLTLKHGPVLTREGGSRTLQCPLHTHSENLLAAFLLPHTLWPQGFREMKEALVIHRNPGEPKVLSPWHHYQVMWGWLQSVFAEASKHLSQTSIHL